MSLRAFFTRRAFLVAAGVGTFVSSAAATVHARRERARRAAAVAAERASLEPALRHAEMPGASGMEPDVALPPPEPFNAAPPPRRLPPLPEPMPSAFARSGSGPVLTVYRDARSLRGRRFATPPPGESGALEPGAMGAVAGAPSGPDATGGSSGMPSFAGGGGGGGSRAAASPTPAAQDAGAEGAPASDSDPSDDPDEAEPSDDPSAPPQAPPTALGEPDRRPLVTLSDPVRHAIARWTFGATPGLVEEVEEIGVDAFLDQQLAPETLDDSALDAVLAEIPILGMTGGQLASLFAADDTPVADAVRHATLLRALWSRRQLFETLVGFWHDHFSIHLEKSSWTRFFHVPFDRDVIRRFALGSFSDLLVAVTRSPSMLHFLDNDQSRGNNPNENLARELLELHTVGVAGGYDDGDVRNAALVLSGWTIGADREFEFRASWHHAGPVQVMGWTSNGTAGAQDGIDLCRYLARHPSTATFLARKLCRRFVSDEPPESLVQSVASVYLASETAIVPVLRHLFASAEFWGSAEQKLRRPFEALVATLRAVNAAVQIAGSSDGARSLRQRLEALGHPLFGWPTPDGYPDVAAPWIGADSALVRFRLAPDLAHGRLAGVVADLVSLLPSPLPATAGELVSAAAARLLTRPLDASTWSALLDALDTTSGERVAPDFLMRKGPLLASLLLSSPELQIR